MSAKPEITKAKTLIAMAIHERIVGPLLRLLSISKRHSQCHSVPGCQPAVAAAISCMDIRFSSSEYATMTPEYLAACEAQAKAYRDFMSHDGLLSEGILRRDLAGHAYMICFVVPDLVAEIRRLRAEGEAA